MTAIFSRSAADLADPRILGILLRSLLVTLLIFAVLGIGIGWLLDGRDICGWIGEDSCILGTPASAFGAFMLTALAMWFLFPAIALGVICAYVDRISAIIEAKHYPLAAASARPPGLVRSALIGLRSAVRVLLYNLVALPLYILLLVTGVGTLVAFILVNGIAFGRDLGEMVAARHGDRVSRREWLQGSRMGRALIGMAVTALFLIPFANLLAPILGAVMTTHYYHATARRTG